MLHTHPTNTHRPKPGLNRPKLPEGVHQPSRLVELGVSGRNRAARHALEAHAAGEAALAALRGAGRTQNGVADCCGAPRLSQIDCPGVFGLRARLNAQRRASAHLKPLAFLGAAFLIAGAGLAVISNFHLIAFCAEL